MASIHSGRIEVQERPEVVGLPRIVEAHEGRIWIESEPGKGTAVHFTLSLPKPDATTS